ncbi:hypothetical protein [Pseudomonas viridiflava]|uniref:hypothetical protein n=1 Tax=Pseudomonas viridiflava TaxID=33069 RepID=UPI000F04AFC5|nr:hypothetical protein [Pseudomonas viridiflava]
MNKNKKWFLSTVASAVLLASSCQLLAQACNCDDPVVPDVVVEEYVNAENEPVVTGLEPQLAIEPAVVPEEQSAAEAPDFIVLSDKIHQIQKVLENSASVHHYSFTSVRGQDVLLGTPEPERKTLNQLWKVEYQVNGGDWKIKGASAPEAFHALDIGSVVNVRVSAVKGAQIENAPYKIVLGSYPHRDYTLHHEEGLARFPHDFSKDGFIATQAIEKSMLEVKFWDSKGAPLEGGVLELRFGHFGPVNLGSITLVSGSDGKASRLLEFGKCEGGTLAKEFTQNLEKGRATWASRYRTGTYVGTNVLLDHLADKPHVYLFGHICNRFLINWQSRK